MTNDAGGAIEARVTKFFAALERRHLSELTFSEVARALRALSAGYVEKRRSGGIKTALQGRGKRAAFALYQGAMHFRMTLDVVRDLQLDTASMMSSVLDLGCGTGVCGSAWSLAGGSAAIVEGIDVSNWALDEARWTYRTLGLSGRAYATDISTFLPRERPAAVIAGWVLNELEPAARDAVTARLLDWTNRGSSLLVLEPVARRVAPWWDEWVPPFVEQGARVIEYRAEPRLSSQIELLGRSAGLDARRITLRVCALAGRPRP